MFTLKDAKNLHVVRIIMEILKTWWQIETTIIDERDFPDSASVMESPTQWKEFTKNQALQFENPLLTKLFQQTPAQQSLFEILDANRRPINMNQLCVLEKWPLTGIYLLILPIQAESYFSGFIIVSGFLTEESQREQAIKDWVALGFESEWCKENVKKLSIIKEQDKNYLIDLCELIAKEIISVQKEYTEQTNQIKEIKKSNSLCYGNMVGKSKSMHQLYNLLEKIKYSHNTILIQGENGTGKELIARSIHDNSPRQNENFIVQNCSALNDNLLESELFGHLKGSFTGAYRDKKGLFEMADKGTFFLDEIGDTSPAMQVKLLRVIQDGTFFPVGSVEQKKVNARIIAATNKNLKQMIEAGTFREDLYYRLNVINLQVPPLRDRKDDIPLLAEFFINRASRIPKVFTKKAMEKLVQYSWPGNVRELQNEAERIAIFSSDNPYIKEDLLSKKITTESGNQYLLSASSKESGKVMKKAIASLERQLISRSLREEGWNKTRVAKKLGISRAALVSKVKGYKLERRAK